MTPGCLCHLAAFHTEQPPEPGRASQGPHNCCSGDLWLLGHSKQSSIPSGPGLCSEPPRCPVPAEGRQRLTAPRWKHRTNRPGQRPQLGGVGGTTTPSLSACSRHAGAPPAEQKAIRVGEPGKRAEPCRGPPLICTCWTAEPLR